MSAHRFEDERFLRGNGRYVADINRENQLHAKIVRSIHGHARIIDIDIIFFNGQEINDENLTIPHKEWKNRLFVIAPLYEVLDRKIEESKFNISNQKVVMIGSIKI